MGRLGYVVLLLMLVAGAAYVFWPEAAEAQAPPLWRGETPSRYQVVAGGLTQEVDGSVVRIHQLERPLDANRHDELWSYVRSLTVVERLITSVPEDQLPAYGIDGSRELMGGGLRLRWGGTGDDTYVWDGAHARLVPCERAVATRLDALTGRLDQARLIDLQPLRGIGLDGLTLHLEGGAWRDAQLSERPDFNRRVNRLYDLLELLRLDDFSRRAAPLAPPLHQVRLSHRDLDQPERLVRLWSSAQVGERADQGGGLIQVDTLPLQVLSAATLVQWTTVLATFRGDYLFNLETEFGLRPLGEIRTYEGDQLRLRLEKHGLNDVANGRSQWDVVWPGGREAASENAAPAIAMALDEMAVRDARRRLPSDVIPPTARRLVFVFKVDQRTLEIGIDGERVYSPTHIATAVSMPGLHARLVPDDMLDHALTLRGAERVVKVQRQWHQGPRAGEVDVVAVGAGSGSVEGTWQQTWPKAVAGTPVSALAVDRLARALCHTRSIEVRLPTPADRAAVANPAFELDVRFAQAQVKLSNDHTRLSDTTDQDLGFAFVPDGARWRAIDKESGISHLIEAELLDLLQAPLSDDLVMPLVPSLVTRIEINGPSGRFALLRREEAWVLQHLTASGGTTGAPQAADAVEVRRFLRLITGLRSLRADPTAGPFTPAQLVGSVLCVFPGAGEGNARVALSLGQTVDHQIPVIIDGGGLRGLPRGRLYLAEDQLAGVLPPATNFLSAAAVKP